MLKRRLVLGVFLCVNTLVNMDHGSIPAAASEIASDLNLSKFQMGVLGSSIFIGVTLGGVLSAYLFHKLDAKLILCFGTFLNGVLVAGFPLSNSLLLLTYLNRLLTGICQVFLIIYVPVWIDLFGKVSKTLWMTVLQTTVPLGVLSGYALTAFITQTWNWRFTFYAQAFLYIPCVVLMFSFPSRKISYSQDNSDYQSLDEYSNYVQNKAEFLEKLYELFSNRQFLYLMLGQACIYFVVTGLQFWGTDYSIKVLLMEESAVYTYYAATTITGPTLGVLLGGYLSHKAGGYETSEAGYVCAVLGGLGCLVAIPVPLVSSFGVFMGLLWGVLFFGAGMMPCLIGMIIRVVEPQHKALANSVNSIMTNLLGYLPAPLMYGFMCDLTGGDRSNAGMMLVMYWSLLAEFFVILALVRPKLKV